MQTYDDIALVNIPGFSGRYSATSFGDVWCNGYAAKNGRWIKARVMRQTRSTNRYGYTHVVINLTSCNGKKTHAVHSLIARVFLGPCPEGNEVLHKNGDATDNRVDNLRYGTRKENIADSIKHGTHCHGEMVKSAKLTVADVDAIRASYRRGVYGELVRFADKYGVSVSNIKHVVYGNTWKHL